MDKYFTSYSKSFYSVPIYVTFIALEAKVCAFRYRSISIEWVDIHIVKATLSM